MTTAARPTFEPARGGQGKGEKDLSALSKQYSSRDLPSHTKLKYREHGQNTSEELHHRDFRKELEEREKEKSSRPRIMEPSYSSKKARLEQVPTANLDADDPLDDDDDEDNDEDGRGDSGSDSDDDDDETAQLLAELTKIKKERAAEKIRKDMERKQEEERIRLENILRGNPLLSYSAQAAKPDLKVKRRWDDDVVFKNCARSEPDKSKDNFINDSLRSEFHRKFMEKYIK